MRRPTSGEAVGLVLFSPLILVCIVVIALGYLFEITMEYLGELL